MRYGFVLLELIISTLIAGLISTGLLMTIMQMSNVQKTIDNTTSIYGRMAVLQNQMERDVMGAFIPAQVDIIQTSTLKKEEPKKLEKLFYGKSVAQSGRLDLLTFITANPLEFFLGIKDAQPKPRVARVVYRLLPDERRNNSYILTRQEGSSSLHFDNYAKDAQGEFRSFAMIDGIQNLTIHYIAITYEETAEKKIKKIYKKEMQWESEKKEEAHKKTELSKKEGIFGSFFLQKKEPYHLPQQLAIEVSLWDALYQKSRTFQLIIPIAYKTTEIAQEEKKEVDAKEENTENKTNNDQSLSKEMQKA